MLKFKNCDAVFKITSYIFTFCLIVFVFMYRNVIDILYLTFILVLTIKFLVQKSRG